MTIAQALVAFCIAAGLLTIVPGLDTALVLRTAAAEGPRNAALAAFGIVMGCVRRLDRLTGLVFVSFGVKLALVRQR
jgi:threonine/homoserine/homoserine lactone efflux protein